MNLRRLVSVMLVSVLLLFVTACGGSGTSATQQPQSAGAQLAVPTGETPAKTAIPEQPAVQPAPAIPAEPAAGFNGLPAPSEVPRTVSGGLDDDRHRSGRQFEQPANAAKVTQGAGQQALFTTSWIGGASTLADLGYATYELFLPKGYTPAEVMTYWGAGDAVDSDIWFALGNVQNDRWDWFQGAKNTAKSLASLDPYIDSAHPTDPDRVLLLVALTGLNGSTNGELRYVRLGGNILPTAQFSADTHAGPAPLTVGFDASGSSDKEGGVLYHWDFDDDGNFEVQGSVSPTESWTYNTDGTFTCKLVVEDLEGATAEATDQIDVSTNQAPTAVLEVHYWFGDAPLTADLDASRSFDPEGEPLTFKWDLDGDGIYEADTGTTATNSTVVTTPGSQLVGVKVIDIGGAEDFLQGIAIADDAMNSYDEIEPNDDFSSATEFPTPDFKDFDCNLGPGGYDGSLDDWFKFYNDGNMVVTIEMLIADPGSDLELYLYDTDGVTELDKSTNGAGLNETITYFLGPPGGYYVRCQHFAGNTSEYQLAISQAFAHPPTASFTATPSSGTVPAPIYFNASGCNPGGSPIATYEWDFNGDGDYESVKTQTEFTYKFMRHGSWDVGLKVTNTDGAWDATVQTITLSQGTWDETENNDSKAEANPFSGSTIFADLGPGANPNDGDNEDWYQFIALGTGNYAVQMALNHAFGDLDIKMYESDGTTEIGSSNGTDDQEAFDVWLNTGNTYYLKCYASSGGSGYELSVNAF